MWNLYSVFTTRQVFNVARDSAGRPLPCLSIRPVMRVILRRSVTA